MRLPWKPERRAAPGHAPLCCTLLLRRKGGRKGRPSPRGLPSPYPSPGGRGDLGVPQYDRIETGIVPVRPADLAAVFDPRVAQQAATRAVADADDEDRFLAHLP